MKGEDEELNFLFDELSESMSILSKAIESDKNLKNAATLENSVYQKFQKFQLKFQLLNSSFSVAMENIKNCKMENQKLKMEFEYFKTQKSVFQNTKTEFDQHFRSLIQEYETTKQNLSHVEDLYEKEKSKNRDGELSKNTQIKELTKTTEQLETQIKRLESQNKKLQSELSNTNKKPGNEEDQSLLMLEKQRLENEALLEEVENLKRDCLLSKENLAKQVRDSEQVIKENSTLKAQVESLMEKTNVQPSTITNPTNVKQVQPNQILPTPSKQILKVTSNEKLAEDMQQIQEEIESLEKSIDVEPNEQEEQKETIENFKQIIEKYKTLVTMKEKALEILDSGLEECGSIAHNVEDELIKLEQKYKQLEILYKKNIIDYNKLVDENTEINKDNDDLFKLNPRGIKVSLLDERIRELEQELRTKRNTAKQDNLKVIEELAKCNVDVLNYKSKFENEQKTRIKLEEMLKTIPLSSNGNTCGVEKFPEFLLEELIVALGAVASINDKNPIGILNKHIKKRCSFTTDMPCTIFTYFGMLLYETMKFGKKTINLLEPKTVGFLKGIPRDQHYENDLMPISNVEFDNLKEPEKLNFISAIIYQVLQPPKVSNQPKNPSNLPVTAPTTPLLKSPPVTTNNINKQE